MADNKIKIEPELLGVAIDIFQTISEQRAEHSFSFTLTEDGYRAIPETIRVVGWGIGDNKPKLKATALEYLVEIEAVEQGMPVNINLTEYELKSMGEVVVALQKAHDSHKDGELP